MKKLLLSFILVLCMVIPVSAFELLMFSNPGCIYCQKFLNEVEPNYHKSEYAKHLPLKVFDITKRTPEWFSRAASERRIDSINGTPTFVIWDNRMDDGESSELARLVGYDGAVEFYRMIGDFISGNQSLFNIQEREPVEIPPMGGVDRKRIEGSHSHPMDKTPSVPEGVIDSKNIFDHTYQTPQEALKASEWLECDGNIHYHKKEKVWMPCSMH